ncbi:histone-lysine N-methyltransferase PRDM9-like [Cyclopterus lumpus]|nr:histone-lysine N-methyltransferase PRDM9-like [Cyclopterus lumpus]
MSGLHGLKVFINQRLAAAVEDICGHFERTINEYEAEMDRKLLDVVSAAEMKLRAEAGFPADVQQLLEKKEVEVPPHQQDWGSSLDQEDPEPPHIKGDQEDPDPPQIKEEQEELWTSQEGEQLQGLEEAGIRFTFTTVKSEDDEEEAQSSHLHQRQTEQMETEAKGRDYGGPEPDKNLGPHRHLETVQTGDSFEPQTDDNTREPQSGLNSLNDYDDDVVPVNDVKSNVVKKSFTCCECGRKFGRKDSLRRHMRFHTGEKPYSCSACGKGFSQRPNLIRHMRCHSGEKPFSCSFCHTSFAVRSALVNHMRIHTGEKPFSCLYCDKSFTQKGGLKKHMTVHTGEKPYSCPVCDKSFSQKANLTYHFSLHTGQKQFSCSICDKRFTWQSQVRSHKCVGESSGS